MGAREGIHNVAKGAVLRATALGLWLETCHLRGKGPCKVASQSEVGSSIAFTMGNQGKAIWRESPKK